MAKQAIKAPRRSIFMVDPEDVVLVGRDTDDGPNHPLYDIRVMNKPDESIVIGMMQYGVKKPIVVTKHDNRELVVDGRQRVINCREANRRLKEAGSVTLKLPVLPPERGTEAKMLGLGVMLNAHAQGDSELGNGQKAQKLYDMGQSFEVIAMHFRVGVATVRRYMSLLDLIPEIQNLLQREKITATKAYELARKDEKAQKAFVHRFIHGSRSGQHKRRAPSKTALRKIVDHGRGEVSSEFIQGLRYALGLIDADDVKGLQDVIAGKKDLPDAAEARSSIIVDVSDEEKSAAPEPVIKTRLVEGQKMAVKVYPAGPSEVTGQVHVGGFSHDTN